MTAHTIVLAAAVAVVAAMGIALGAERRRHEKEVAKIRLEGAENARHTADIITEANKAKSDANSGDHAGDLRAMADRLHGYAHD